MVAIATYATSRRLQSQPLPLTAARRLSPSVPACHRHHLSFATAFRGLRHAVLVHGWLLILVLSSAVRPSLDRDGICGQCLDTEPVEEGDPIAVLQANLHGTWDALPIQISACADITSSW